MFDVSALRHCEHVANSGWCACSREKALREVPAKPETVEGMYEQLRECHSPSVDERFILSHTPLPGKDVARPCTAHGCPRWQKQYSASQKNTQKHVFWGLTKNIEKHVYHLGSRPVSRNWVTNITRNTALLNKKKVKIDLASP